MKKVGRSAVGFGVVEFRPFGSGQALRKVAREVAHPRHDDLSKLNAALLTMNGAMNGVISVVSFIFVGGDGLLRR